MPPVLPAILLAIWATGTCTLALVYGFDKRWADSLDSFSLFRFGADLSDQVKDNPAFGTVDAEDCEELEKLPRIGWRLKTLLPSGPCYSSKRRRGSEEQALSIEVAKHI